MWAPQSHSFALRGREALGCKRGVLDNYYIHCHYFILIIATTRRKMGICQSQLNSRRANDELALSPSSHKLRQNEPSHRKFTFEPKQSAPSSSCVPKNGFEISMISPAERTEATELDSPQTSIFSSPYTPGTTDELMDIDDASSMAEEDSFSEQNGYFASHQHSGSFLLGDLATEDDQIDEYVLSEEAASPAASRMDSTPVALKAHSQPPSSNIKNRLQTMIMRSPRHDVPDTLVAPSPLLAPPKDVVVSFDSESASAKTSVNPKTLARFNKLKTQARLSAKLNEQRKLKEKIKDRRLDIHGYRNLWQEYTGIQKRMSQRHKDKIESKTSRGISLNDTTTWFMVRRILR